MHLKLAGGLINQRCNVTIIAPRLNWRRPFLESVNFNNQDIPILWLPSPKIWLIGSLIYIATIALYLILERVKCQVVHVGSINRVAAGVILMSRLAGKRVVCRAIGGDARLLSRLTAQKNPVARLHIHTLKASHTIIVQSDDSKNLLIALGIEDRKIILVRNGVDTDYNKPLDGDKYELRAQLGLPSNGKIICCVNRLRPLKQVDVIIRAFHLLHSRAPICHLLVLGRGSELDNLRVLAESLGIADKVNFQGFVPDTLPYLQASDIFVIGSEVENLSNALLEAMACGLGIVATDVGGNKECIQHRENGLLVPVSSHKLMADSFLSLCDDEFLARSYGQKARRSAIEKFSYQRMIDKYLSVYNLTT